MTFSSGDGSSDHWRPPAHATPPAAGQPAAPLWHPATRPEPIAPSVLLVVFTVVGLSALALVLLIVLVYLSVALGAAAVIGCGILALIPLALVVLATRWIDRWEPEPSAAQWFALLWGAGAAVAIALLVDLGSQVFQYLQGAPPPSDFFQAVVQAPLVEESAKGLGVFILFLVLKRTFDGPVDGVVYAALTAGGFAFVENIIYFGSALADGGGGELAGTFFLRGLMSPFAHVMFTSCTGLALGIAALKPGVLRTAIALVLGLLTAVLLHALWNSAAYLAADFIGYYVLVQMPMFALAIVLVLWLRRREARLIRRRLLEYANAGWLTGHDVTMLGTATGRRGARAWAKSRQPSASALMKRFIQDATRLAYTRQRIVSGRDRRGALKDEKLLLAAVVADRNEIIALR
ncbi:PrsW family intramembrane metalloprotease [Rathayibacter soli]|uniref:PrsW family intramembrane metalloprotease n=1 Tax=Rathayibacter soli TaxID=3144168 RepID=UPI0027E4E366|nr:PrsW family intramembrane metalloprotease [Glaciibacter superstes]